MNKIQITSWENATLANRFMFYKIFTNNPDKCKRLLEILLHMEIERIESPYGEANFEVDFDSKGIRLDVYTKADGRKFDLELQNVDTKDLAKRSRYYQGLMDIDTLKHSQPYSNLPESYVIFLCMEDIFGCGLPVYSFQNICSEDTKIKMNDGTYKIFFNAQKYDIMPSEEEKDFFKFLSGGSADSEFTKDLDLLVTSARHNAQWRQQFMTWEQEVQLSYNRGLEEGQKIGKKEGELIGQKEALKKYAISMLKDAILPLEKISEYTQIPLEELETLTATQCEAAIAAPD